ncbi:TadE/TadG family type IV pilus assembly protein [Tessaracoccus oleiagri]|uniref:TadE-like protein n=1 Tax=Tessaracoccus oleiagri TaxID=686624 RepID=A0A1G9JV45_9ACTN|nr:TadE family protein [Tessaracoccus oleiagri]SDL41024.1 TadE-like protein [Tessaracoccus oleiagri]
MRRNSKGAAAVEFALVLPVLVTLILGSAEFGFLAYLNASAAGAAREAARVMAISQDEEAAREAIDEYFVISSGPTYIDVPATCSAGAPVEVYVEYRYDTLTKFFGEQFTARGRGEMRCGG